MSITIVGLGPGGPELLTRQAESTLHAAHTLFVRTERHPAVAALTGRPFHSFDAEYDRAESFEDLYHRIALAVFEAGAVGDVVYAVPGHPLVGEATVQHIQRFASSADVPVRIIAGLSFVEPALAAVGVDAMDAGVQIADAHAPMVDPFRPALIAQVYDRRLAGVCKLALLEQYPAEHEVTIIRHAGLDDERTSRVPLFELDHRNEFDHLTSLYVPALPILDGIGSEPTFKEVVYRLRRECPWDREQTHESLRKYLIEETFESVDALDRGDLDAFAGELGDVLLQVYLHSAIGEESDEFSLRDVFDHITRKLIRRHPHVFGDLAVSTPEQVEQNWDKIKAEERGSAPEQTGLLDSVPGGMPALSLGQALERRAGRAGFEWETIDGAWLKLAEELGELRMAATKDDRFWELGDVLLVMVDLARWYDLEAEDALRAAAHRFRRRFAALERLVADSGRPMDAFSRSELLALWPQTKLTGDLE